MNQITTDSNKFINSDCEHTTQTAPVLHKESTADFALRIIEKVSVVALGVFSAMADIQLFIPFFLVGAAIGTYNYFNDSQQPAHANPAALLEQLTGIRLPKPVSLLANAAAWSALFIIDKKTCASIAGLSIGALIGKNALHGGSLLYRKIEEIASSSLDVENWDLRITL